MTTRIAILNGPNLNMLGVREPGVYGSQTLADIEQLCKDRAALLGMDVTFMQSNSEGILVDAIHAAHTAADAIIINPAAYTHTSVALRDALSAVALPCVEVHLSNVHKREEFRHHSYISGVAVGVIAGLGAQGYVAALDFLHGHLAAKG